MGAECHHACPYKKDRDLTDRRGEVTSDTDLSEAATTMEFWGSHQKLEEADNEFSPRASRGNIALLTP